MSRECLPSVQNTVGRASGPTTTIRPLADRSSGSAFGLRSSCSVSAHRPVGSTLAPPDTLGLTAPTGSLVPQAPPWSSLHLCHGHADLSPLRLQRPSPSLWLHRHTAIASGLRQSGSTSDDHLHGIAQASCASDVAHLHRLSICALGSIGSVSVGRHPVGVCLHATLAPPSFVSTMGCYLWVCAVRCPSSLGSRRPYCTIPSSSLVFPLSSPQPPPKPPPFLLHLYYYYCCVV